MSDGLDAIKELLTTASDAILQRRGPDAVRSLMAAYPLLVARGVAGNDFSAQVSLQAALMAVMAADVPLAHAFAALAVSETADELERRGCLAREARALGDLGSWKNELGPALLYAVAFVPFVPPRLPRIAAELEAAVDGGTMLRTFVERMRPQLDAAGWAAWPYPAEVVQRVRAAAAFVLTEMARYLIERQASGTDVEDAQRLADTALALLAGTPAGQTEADALNVQGRVRMQYGVMQSAAAVPFFERAIAVLERIGNGADAATDHGNLGGTYVELAEFQAANGQAEAARASEAAAERHLQSALASLRSDDPWCRLAGTLSSFGLLAQRQGRWDEACARLNEAWHAADGNPRVDAPTRASIALNLGSLLRERKQFTDAQPWYRRALDAIAAVPAGATSPLTAIKAQGGLGAVLLRTSGAPAAEPLLTAAVAALERYQASFLAAGPGFALVSGLLWIYEACIDCNAQLGANEPLRRSAAFATAERIRWRMLTTVLRFEPLRLPPGPDEALLREERDLLAPLQALLGDPAQAAGGPSLDALQVRLEAIWDELEARHPEHVAIRRQQTVSAADAEHLLDDDVPVLLAYYLGADDGTALAFVIRRGDPVPAVVRLPLGTEPIAALVAELRAFGNQSDLVARTAAARRLHAAILEPVLGLVPEGAGVCVVPSGPLHDVAFATLHDGTRYAVQRNPFVTAASATGLRWWQRKDRRSRGRGLLFTATSGIRSASGAYPDLALFGGLARDELVQFFAHGELVAGSEATRERFLRELDAPAQAWDVVHLACHGVFAPTGFDSFLALAPDEHGPTALSAKDIVALVRPDTTLVTLSACESATSAKATGDEVAGLTHAFLIAGASSVIASLWLVRQDVGVALMRRFYELWLRRDEGGAAPSKLRALQAAQCELLAGSVKSAGGNDLSHPYLWGAFALSGNWA